MLLPEEKLARNQIVIEKGNLGYQVFKEQPNSYSIVKKYLESKFVIDKYFIANSRDGKYNRNKKYRNTQEQFVGNYYKLDT